MTGILKTTPVVLEAGEGEAVWFCDCLTTIKATGDDTNGLFSLTEHLLPAGAGIPLHIHEREDEAFYLLEGRLSITCDGSTWEIGAGGFAFLPRNVLHAYQVVGDTSARMLVFTTPSGFERFVEVAGEPARERALPPAGTADFGKVIGLATTQYRIQFPGTGSE